MSDELFLTLIIKNLNPNNYNIRFILIGGEQIRGEGVALVFFLSLHKFKIKKNNMYVQLEVFKETGNQSGSKGLA